MKVAKVLAVTVLWVCWISSTVEPQGGILRITFSADDATKSKYDMFYVNLIDSLSEHGSIVQGIRVLPSPTDLQPTDLRRYLIVQLFSRGKNVSLVIDVTNVYVLGYRPGDGTTSYFFMDVPQTVRDLFFEGTTREVLRFNGSYPNLENLAGDRENIPLGFEQLRQKIENLNYNTPKGDVKQIASALIVCIEMISEAARYTVIQRPIAAVAPLVKGGPEGMLYPNSSMMGYENKWGQLSAAIQSSRADGTFPNSVTITHELSYSDVESVRPVIKLLLYWPGTTFSLPTVFDQVIDETLGQI